TNEFIKEVDGEKIIRTDWHHISTWGKTADACARMLRKGSKVLVEGKLRNSNNEHNSNYEIFAIDVTFLSNYGTEN
ncbi:MAG: single-stranded DNA-binding protein, partial [Oligoflexia bacterium]|nr:single-stranded DNA-binding protein [Oligoflexia bacterium]